MSPVTPEWLERMKPRQWYAISGDAPDLGLRATAIGTRYLVETDPARDPRLNPARTLAERCRRALGREPRSPWAGSVGFGAITEAWNSAVFASGFGRSGSMIVFGGGHDDYFGSSVHAFDLASRQWRRIADGYVRGGAGDYGEGARYPSSTYPDGSPLPPHTYDYVQYDAAANDYILLKGQTELGPRVRAAAIPHMFHLDALRWRRGPEHPHAILNSGGCSTWDASRRVLWGHAGDDGGGNAFVGFAPDGQNQDGTCGLWSVCVPSKLPGIANHNAMQIFAPCDVIVMSVHARNGLHALDPADPERPATLLAASGAKPILQPFAALQYAPSAAQLVYFSPLDGGIVHTIAPVRAGASAAAPGDWTWKAHALPAHTLNPIADAARRSRHRVNLAHVFGRFRVASFDGMDVAILVRHVDTPVYAWRFG